MEILQIPNQRIKSRKGQHAEQNLEDLALTKSFSSFPSSNRGGWIPKNQCSWKERESRVDEMIQQESLPLFGKTERSRGIHSQDNQSTEIFNGGSKKDEISLPTISDKNKDSSPCPIPILVEDYKDNQSSPTPSPVPNQSTTQTLIPSFLAKKEIKPFLRKRKE
ncbi:hypothetical protein U1Q18_007056 [Sarracenia purpurea var. burkii]